MALERARESGVLQAGFGSFYNGISAKLILSEIKKELGQAAVDKLIVECRLDQVFDFKPGMRFEKGIAFTSYE